MRGGRLLMALALTGAVVLGAVRQVRSQDVTARRAADPPAASVRVKVAVPPSMRGAPFDVDRFLDVPPGFAISVYARVDAARFMAVAPNGDLLVSDPGSGAITLVRPDPNGGDPTTSTFVGGLQRPHDIVFHKIWVYISEKNQIDRYPYATGDTSVSNKQVVVKNLPDASLPELHGSYGHELKNIAVGSDDRLYVSIGSTCNVCTSGTVSNPQRAAIYTFDANGTDQDATNPAVAHLFAHGLRNAEGLAFVPGTNTLWVAVNNRDNTPYPFTGRSTYSFGQVTSAYVDNHPPDEFTSVRDGGDYGWPFCNPDPDLTPGAVVAGNDPSLYNYDNMPFDVDYDFNRYGISSTGSGATPPPTPDPPVVDCTRKDRIAKGIPAHSAALGLTFLIGTAFPQPYRQGAVVALHGSWNRAQKTGYKVIYYPWVADAGAGHPGAQEDLVSGWLDAASNSNWGRPVDAAVDPQGDLLISDETAGAIYKLSPISNGTPTPSASATPASTATQTAMPATATPTATATSAAPPDLAVRLRRAGSFRPGQTVRFLAAVRNVGAGPTSGPIALTVSLSAGMTPSVAGLSHPAGWSCTGQGQGVRCQLPAGAGALGPGGGADLAIGATIDPALRHPTLLILTASVGTPGDADARNDTARSLVRVP